METIVVLFTSSLAGENVHDISKEMQHLDRHRLRNNPWKFPYHPYVSFSVAYDNGNIYLKFFVQEKDLRAITVATNNAVFEDSCVEFFISLPGDSGYYNFELNSVGVCRAACSKIRLSRQFLNKESISEINRYSYIKQFIRWYITVKFPFSVFINHKLTSLKGTACKANFYKCGGKLRAPHYLSWNNIIDYEPNFHRPECFGYLKF